MHVTQKSCISQGGLTANIKLHFFFLFQENQSDRSLSIVSLGVGQPGRSPVKGRTDSARSDKSDRSSLGEDDNGQARKVSFDLEEPGQFFFKVRVPFNFDYLQYLHFLSLGL